jgi:hypothetical protein
MGDKTFFADLPGRPILKHLFWSSGEVARPSVCCPFDAPITSFILAVPFLYVVAFETPWGKECFPRVRVPYKLRSSSVPAKSNGFFNLCARGRGFPAWQTEHALE